MGKEKIYDFRHYEFALTAFVAYFEGRLHAINDKIPVFVLDTGDDTFLLKKKFEESTKKEIYLPVPRCVLNIGESSFQTDQDTSQHIECKYIMPNDKIYKAKFRRKATTIPISLEFVCSNYVKGLQYLEIIQSLMSNENVFTYKFLGIDFQGSYKSETFSLEKNGMDANSNKNCVVKATIDLQLQVFIVWYNSIKYVGSNLADFDKLVTQIDIVAKMEHCLTSTPPDYETQIRNLQNE